MKIKRLFAFVVAALSLMPSWADGPYRAHRYDSFMACPPQEGVTVFLGNSITNMHNWNEAFGSDSKVLNRGNSGGFASELIEEMECIADFKPAKVFIGIGTNDNSTTNNPVQTAEDIHLLVDRIHLASPQTKIYIQSILPRNSGGDAKHNANLVTNAILAENAADWGAEFIDLSETMAGVRTTTGTGHNSWACDGLHPTAIGYRAWCNAIKDYVNGTCSYSNGTYLSDMTQANPSRISQFSLLPVASDDILFLGDEMVENGEWNELLRLPNIKKRSNGYGHGGISLLGARGAKDLIRCSLLTDPETQKSPKKILIYCGVAELAGSTAADTYKANYKTLVDYIHEIAPSTEVYAVSMLPVNNATLAGEYNTKLQELAADDSKLTYIDIASPIVASTDMSGNYVYGRGYVRIANAIAPYVGAANPVKMEEFEAYYASRTARRNLGKVYNKVWKALDADNFGNIPGQFVPASKAKMQTVLSEIGEALTAVAAPTQDEINALSAKADEAIEITLPSADNVAGRYFTLTSNRGSLSLSANGNFLNGVAAGETTQGADVWRLEPREDGTFNVVNLLGQYIQTFTGSTTVSVSVGDTAPAVGVKFDMSNTPGYAVIYAENGNQKWQLNQQNGGANVWNWYGSSCPNKDDQGCAYAINEFTGKYVPSVANGWYTIDIHSYEGANTSLISWTKNVIDANTNHLVVADNHYWQASTSSWYNLGVSAVDEAAPAKHLFYVEHVSGSDYYVRSSNGHYILPSGTATHEATAVSLASHSTLPGIFVSPWCVWQNNNIGCSAHDLIGTFSGNTTNFAVTLASTTAYDLWNVSIIAPAGETLPTDAFITYTGTDAKGATKLYNNGTLFLAKGSTLTADQLTCSVADARINVNGATKTITVKAGEEENLWFTIKGTVDYGSNAIAGKTIEALASPVTRSNGIYELNFVETPTNVVASYFHIVRNAAETQMTFTSVDGRSYAVAGIAMAAPQTLTVSKNADGNFAVQYWTPFTENGKILVGKSGSNTTAYSIEQADIAEYDIWGVKIVGAQNQELTASNTNIHNNINLTISSDANRGMAKAYNNGYFFLTKGTEVTPDMFTIGGNTSAQPRQGVLTVDNAAMTITVDYVDHTPAPEVTGITIDKTALDLLAGQEQVLNASVQPEGIAGAVVSWSTDNAAVATVSIGGLVKAIAPGTATITASCLGFTVSCIVTVSERIVAAQSITLSETSVTIEERETHTLTATVSPDDVTDPTIEWTSSNPVVAAVDGGVVTALTPGTAIITAKCGDATASCTVSVIEGKEDVSIQAVGSDMADTVYDLQGRRIVNPSRGLYIINNRLIRK